MPPMLSVDLPDRGVPSLSVAGLDKSFGDVKAVGDMTFEVLPGRVTGFIGRNGAGKSTTLRLLLGLLRPDAGSALVAGMPFVEARAAGVRLGCLIDPGFHPARSALAHLEVVATATGSPLRRAQECLEAVGLQAQAKTKAKGLSMGQRQRLGLATAILAEPEILVLDEPLNGLDPDGVRWLRRFLSEHARNGGTVFLSSHLLAELEQSVDDVILIDQRVLWAGTARAFLDTVEPGAVLSTADDRGAYILLEDASIPVRWEPGDRGLRLSASALPSAEATLASAGWPIVEQTPFTPTFEDAMYACIDRTHELRDTEAADDAAVPVPTGSRGGR